MTYIIAEPCIDIKDLSCVDVCPVDCIHLQGPLGRGRVEDCVLTCPWHGWQYDVRTGRNVFDRAIQLRTFEVQVEDGDVRVRV